MSDSGFGRSLSESDIIMISARPSPSRASGTPAVTVLCGRYDSSGPRGPGTMERFVPRKQSSAGYISADSELVTVPQCDPSPSGHGPAGARRRVRRLSLSRLSREPPY